MSSICLVGVGWEWEWEWEWGRGRGRIGLVRIGYGRVGHLFR